MRTYYMWVRIAGLALGLAAALGLTGCGGGGPVPQPTPTPTPAPTITSLSPSTVTAGGPAFTLTVNGANYFSASVVQWNGSPRATTFVSSTQLQGAITSADIASGAQETVTVANPQGQGGVSSGFTVTANNPVPSISNLNPSALAAGAPAFTLTVTGSNFVPASVVQFNGSARPTTFISSTTLQAAISSGDITKVGLSAVAVFNPAPAGGTSSNLAFTAAFPPPKITLLQPSSAVSGGAGFTMTVTGTNFVPSSVVKFNGNSRTTTFVSSTQLQAAITAADIASIGVANVTVVNVVTNTASVIAANSGVDPTTSSPTTFFTGTTGGPGFAQVIINQTSRDLAYDSSQQLIYVTVPSAASTNPNTLSVLNLANVQITSSQAVGTNPGFLAMSTDGQFLYAGIDGAASVQRFTLPGPTKDISIPLGSDPFFGPFFAQDLQVAPGFPHTLAVTLANSGVSPPEQGGVAIFDDATQRPTKFPGGANLVTSLQWGADATKLFGSDIFNGLDALSVNAGGATLNQSFHGILNGDRIHLTPSTGVVYGEGGEVVQATNGSTSGNFNVRGPMVTDQSLNAVFVAPQFPTVGTGNLEAFDLTRFTLNRSITLPGVNGTPRRLIRWGQNGLAFNTDNGQIVIVAGNFLDPVSAPSATPIPTPTPTPTPNPNPQAPTITFLNPGSAVAGSAAFTLTVNGTNFSSSSVVQFNGSARTTSFISATQLQATVNAADIATPGVSTISVNDPTNGPSAGSSFFTGNSGGTGFAVATVSEPSQDMVLDPARQALYLSVPNTVPEGNSIAVLDLATATILGTQFAGSNPDVLAISDDSQFLYAGIDGNASVQRFILPALGMDIAYPVGSDPFFGPYFALDLQVAPGAPHTSAMSAGLRGSSPQALGGITIFDDATARPTKAPGFAGGGLYDSIQWGHDATSMVAANGDDTGFDFYTLSVNASGITQTKDISSAFGSFGNKLHFDRGTNLVYSNDGRALDPSSGLPAGMFQFQTFGVMVPDSSLNTAFFLSQPFGSSTATIKSFDLTHFTSVGSINVPNVRGQAKKLIRWGQNGLAFNTDIGNVYLVGGSFLTPVPTTFPAPAPLPTPAPTPAPGAPVISLLTPSSAIAGGATFTITVTGANFDPTAVVQFNGTALSTVFGSSTQLQATVSAASIASPGTAIITVVGSGGTSAGSTFFTGSSGGSNFAVSTITQPANDLIFDPLHRVILISIPSTAPAHGNTISALDPASETIISSQFAGSEPGVLALSDDSQFLYAGINGAAKVQRFTLPDMGTDISYPLGTGVFGFGSNIAQDLQVAPGAPHTTAVTTEQDTITIFDDATARAATAGGGGSIQWGTDTSTLLSNGGFFGDLLTFSVTAGGLTKTNDVELAIGNRIHFDRSGNHLLWAENGHVVDPVAGSAVAVLSAAGPTVPDSGLNAAFVLTQLGPSVTLHAIDMTHFIEVGSITIPNVNGNAKRLIRWGQNGLAFNTDNGQIYLVAGNFVSPIVTATGPANPLPPPPPTPAVNAPVISKLSPSFAVAGGATFTIQVTGTNFDPAAVLQFNGSPLTTTVNSATSLQATILSTDIATAGTASITVLNPVSTGGLSAGFTFFVGASGGSGFAVTELNQPANDLVFDPLHQVILLSVPGSAAANGNSISAIDLSGNILSSQFAGSQPNVLALSADSTALYSGIDGASKVQRFALPSLSPDISYSLGGGGFNGLSTALDVQVAPGAPQTSAVVINQANPSGQIIIFDNATPRAGTVNNGNSIQWGTNTSALYSSSGFTSDFLTFTVSAGGLTLNHDFQSFLSGKRIHFDPVTSLVYSDGGAVIDPGTGLAAATFKASGLMVVDPGLNAAFFLQLPINGNTANIVSFDLTHFVSTGTISIPGVTGNPGRLIRWGQNGMAFNTADGHLFLIGGDFVSASSLSLPPTNPLPTPTPFTPGPLTPTISSLNPGSAAAGGNDVSLTVNGTNFTASSVVQFNGSPLTTIFTSANVLTATIPAAKIASSGTALLTVLDPSNGTSNTSTFLVGGTAGTGTGGTTFAFSAISQAANDLIFDPVHQVFLVSVPSNASSLGNTVDALDLSGNLISTQFAGSEPTMLALSDDAQFLYAGINGAGKAQRFSLPAFTSDINYSLGPPNFFGQTVALNLEVAPGAPHTVAYATGAATSFFETEGVAVFDDQTQRTNRPFTSTSWIQWGANNSTLFGADTFATDLSVMTVDSNGVTVQQLFSSAFSGANQIRFEQATGFVYGNDGRVVNPSTGALVGSYTLPVANGPKFMVPDSTVGKAFFLTQTAGTPTTITLESFDLTHFTAISSISFNVTGTAQNLVRWGSNGLAFRTNQGQIVLVAGTFVN